MAVERHFLFLILGGYGFSFPLVCFDFRRWIDNRNGTARDGNGTERDDHVGFTIAPTSRYGSSGWGTI